MNLARLDVLIHLKGVNHIIPYYYILLETAQLQIVGNFRCII